MPKALTATASEKISASPAQVWDALTDPEKIKQYFFGSEIVTDWREGSPIIYKGEYEGKKFEDKGKVVRFEPEKTLVCTHWSPLSGMPDKPENYHEVTYTLTPEGAATRVSISQDNNADEDEKQRSSQLWQTMLKNMKQLLEK
jgi:uncharacterized protein YndB with AHSA1/START domain